MSAQTAGGPEAWRRTEAGGEMKKILKRWLILACLGAAAWGGYLLWPALVTGPLPVLRLPDDPYLSGLEVGTGMKAAVRELAYDYYERGLARQGGPGEKLVARAVERAKASAPQNVAQEIRGLANGAGVPERLIWEANIAVDLYCHSSLMACSALVEPKQGGGFLVGRNLDFLDFGVLLDDRGKQRVRETEDRRGNRNRSVRSPRGRRSAASGADPEDGGLRAAGGFGDGGVAWRGACGESASRAPGRGQSSEGSGQAEMFK